MNFQKLGALIYLFRGSLFHLFAYLRLSHRHSVVVSLDSVKVICDTCSQLQGGLHSRGDPSDACRIIVTGSAVGHRLDLTFALTRTSEVYNQGSGWGSVGRKSLTHYSRTVDELQFDWACGIRAEGRAGQC